MSRCKSAVCIGERAVLSSMIDPLHMDLYFSSIGIFLQMLVSVAGGYRKPAHDMLKIRVAPDGHEGRIIHDPAAEVELAVVIIRLGGQADIFVTRFQFPSGGLIQKITGRIDKVLLHVLC